MAADAADPDERGAVPLRAGRPVPAVIVVIGPSGAGKSVVSQTLQRRLGWAELDADSLHSSEAVAKMAAGEGLTDADRAPWLERVGAWIDERIAAGEPAVVACSALRRRYRDVLRRPEVHFALLSVPAEELARRLGARTGHFAGPDLLRSQLETLEPLSGGEQGAVVDGTAAPEDVAQAILAAVGLGESGEG